jgi:hypothetical protein
MIAADRNSVVFIYWQDGMDNWDSIPGRDKRFFFSHCIQTGSGAHPVV